MYVLLSMTLAVSVMLFYSVPAKLENSFVNARFLHFVIIEDNLLLLQITLLYRGLRCPILGTRIYF